MKLLDKLHILFTILLLNAAVFFPANLLAQHPELSGGNGSVESPYQISKPEDLDSLSAYVNRRPAGLTTKRYYEVTNDIDMAGRNFTPISKEFSWDYPDFWLDGKNHTIKNLTIAKGNNYCGLFGRIDGSRQLIKDLRIENFTADIETTQEQVYAGGIIGYYSGSNNTITNCTVSGKIMLETCPATVCIGGLVGYSMEIDYEDCKNYVDIKVNYGQLDEVNSGIGGIIGSSINEDQFNTRRLSRCSNYGNITGPSYVGGLVGRAFATTISKCNNSGRITFSDDYAGGIVGKADNAAIDFSCNIGTVVLSFDDIEPNDYKNIRSRFIGGIIGHDVVSRTVYDIYHLSDNLNTGNIYGWDYTGGIAGYPWAFTYNNVNIGLVYDARRTLPDYNVKSGANCASYPFEISGRQKNSLYGGALYDKQMSLLTDSMNGKVFEKIARISELYTSQMMYDSIHHHFLDNNEKIGPHKNTGYDWVYNEGVYAVPNTTDPDFNVLASLALRLDSSDRVNDVNHQFQIATLPVEEGKLEIKAASEFPGRKLICKVAGNTIGLVGTGLDTLRIFYKGMMREIPLVVNSVDTLMFSGGSGTAESPYLISCLKDLRELEFVVRKYPNDKHPEENWSYGKHFKVIANIDSSFNGTIGLTEERGKAFQGKFDGNGKRITINRERERGINALFGKAIGPCEIKNLEVNGRINRCEKGAGIVGIAENITIDSCLNMVNINVTDTAGGIAAIARDCKISNCGNNGLVRSNKLSGGIIGYCNNGIVNDIVNGGSVLSANVAGGLMGSIPNTTVNTGVNYGYTGRTGAEIDGTKIGYTIGETGNGTEINTYWNAQTNTIWDSTWVTEGMSTEQMLTDKDFKEKLGEVWHTASDTTLVIPTALKKFGGTILLNMPYSFKNKWNTLKDLNDELKIPGEQFLYGDYSTNLALGGKNIKPTLEGTITPNKFGSDTLTIKYYYAGLSQMENSYTKLVPLFITRGFASGGNGTKENPYLIANEKDFDLMVATMTEDYYCVDTLRNASWHKHFKQTGPIAKTITTPIGSTRRERYEWSGHYDGNGNTLNVDIKNAGKNAGLFATVAKAGSIMNLTVTGLIEGTDNCGAITGELKGNSLIANCHNRATIKGNSNVGGIVGKNTGSNITGATNSNRISGLKNVGGICGHANKGSKNADLLNTGNINGNNNIGGIIGNADSSDVRRTVNAGLTKGKENVGGIAGLYLWNGDGNNLIFQSMNYGHVDKEGTHVGAIVGKNENDHGTNVTLCFYNYQTTMAKAVDGEDNPDFASGLSTRDFLGDNLYLKLDDDWALKANQYPMPALLNGTEVAVASNPALFADNETYINIGTEFEVVTENGVNWSSKLGKVDLEGKIFNFKKSGIDTLIAEKDGITKEQPIFITNGLFSGGNGTEKRPYRITCKQDMEDLAMYVNTNMLEETGTKNWSDGLFFSLENDIEPDSIITTTVGLPDTEREIQYIHFGGTFKGHGHRMRVNIDSDYDNVGLFGYLSKSTIDSLYIYGTIKGTSNVGGFAGYSENSTISNCQNAANISGNNDAGGICGYVNRSRVELCSNAGTVESRENKAAGIVAEATNSAIVGCVNIAKIVAYTSNSYTGGICGRLNGTSELSNCLNSGIIQGENSIGGIVGEAGTTSTISNCIVTNDVELKGHNTEAHKGYVCGVFGKNGQLTNCFVDSQCNDLKDAQDSAMVKKLLTRELTGTRLKNELTDNVWMFDENKYPRPCNDTIALLGASAFVLRDNDTKDDINDDFKAYTYEQCGWKSQRPSIVVENEKAKLVSMGNDTLIAFYDNLEKKVAVNIACITIHKLDTVVGCDSVLYDGRYFYENISFNDTLKSKETGCDSIVGVEIVVNHTSAPTTLPTIYATNDTTINGIKCTNDTTLYMTNKNSVGCDSLVIQEVNVVKTRTEEIEVEPGCDSTEFRGGWMKQDTIVTERYKDEHDRDTLVISISIHVNHSLVELADTIRGYDSVAVSNVYYYNDTLLLDTTKLETGCDHIVRTPVEVGVTERIARKKTYCASNDNLLYLHDKEVRITADTTVYDTTAKTNKLLQVTIYTVEVKQPKDTVISLSECKYIDFRGKRYTESVTLDSVYATEWCDSTVHYKLNVLKPAEKVDTIADCYVTTYKGIVYTENTTLYDTVPGASENGCDSLYVTHIVVKESTSDTLHTYGLEEKVVYGVKVTNDTIFIDTLVNAAGCDSLLYTKVHITHFTRDTTTLYGCDSLYYYGIWYTSNAGIETKTYDPNNKWDDLDQVNVNYLSHVGVVSINIGKQQIIDNYIDDCERITFRGIVYTQDTVICDTTQTKNGCDQITRNHLRLHKPTTEGVKHIVGCGEAIWNDKVYDKDTTFAEQLVTKWGCDSICNIVISIHQPDENYLIRTGCEVVEYDGESFTNDTTLTRVYKNQGGCDSTVYIHIKVYKTDRTTVTYEGEYDVVYNGRKYTRSTVFRDTLTNKHGCDSIVTIAIIVSKALDYPLIVNKYDYMLLCNNNIGNDKYATYQWYKNGKMLSGETKAYMSEQEGTKLSGCYQVYVTTTRGEEYFSEEICIEAEKTLRVYPNPVKEGEPITIDYDFTAKQRKGLYYDVYNSEGIKVHSEMPTSFPIEIPGQRKKGYYFILITTGEDKNLGTKFIVK